MQTKHTVGQVLRLGALFAATACSRAPASDASPSVAPLAPEAAPGRAAASEPLPFLATVAAQPAKAKASLTPCPKRVPEALNPPAEATLDLALPADGVQVYACASAKAGEAPAWTLEGPHALLRSPAGVSGIHFAGPTWQGLDGSSVKGAKLAAADAPKPGAVPWLLLSAAPAPAAGSFAHVTFIQRLDTVGGTAPASGCDPSHLGAKALVPYKATYYFYRPAEAGEAVRQCRSEPAKPAR